MTVIGSPKVRIVYALQHLLNALISNVQVLTAVIGNNSLVEKTIVIFVF